MVSSGPGQYYMGLSRIQIHYILMWTLAGRDPPFSKPAALDLDKVLWGLLCLDYVMWDCKKNWGMIQLIMQWKRHEKGKMCQYNCSKFLYLYMLKVVLMQNFLKQRNLLIFFLADLGSYCLPYWIRILGRQVPLIMTRSRRFRERGKKPVISHCRISFP